MPSLGHARSSLAYALSGRRSTRLWPIIRIESRARFSSTASTGGEGPFRILFCGSDDFSVASLRAVHEARDLWQSIDVVVPSERQVGRGGKNSRHDVSKYIPALKEYSEANNLPILSIPPSGIKSFIPPTHFSSPSPSHLLLTASFGHIIPLSLLNLFHPDKRLNVHPSLLPRWRGASPVQYTILQGDAKTGVSVQRLEKFSKGIDSGDIVGKTSDITVPPDATYNTLLPHLAEIGGDLLVDVLRKLRDGTATFAPQDANYVTLAPKITHDSARIRWSDQTAESIDRLYRGIHHQTSLWTTVRGTTTQLHHLKPLSLSRSAEDIPSNLVDAEAGTAVLVRQGKSRKLVIACAERTWMEVDQVQMAGKKILNVKDWWNGLPKDVRDRGRVEFL